MGKLFTTDTTDTINVAMSIAADCFCSVKATLEISDTEDPRNTAIVLVEESKVVLPSLLKDITYRGDDDHVTVESISATSDQTKELIQSMIDRWLEIYVRIEGI